LNPIIDNLGSEASKARRETTKNPLIGSEMWVLRTKRANQVAPPGDRPPLLIPLSHAAALHVARAHGETAFSSGDGLPELWQDRLIVLHIGVHHAGHGTLLSLLNETKTDVLAYNTLLPKPLPNHHLGQVLGRRNHISKFFSPHFLVNHPALRSGASSKFPRLEICSRFETAML
jgi:hypothetical protein